MSLSPSPSAIAVQHQATIAQALARQYGLKESECNVLSEEAFAVEGTPNTYGFLILHPYGLYGVQATLKDAALQDFRCSEL